MERVYILSLIVIEVGLGIRLTMNNDLSLGFLIVLSQALFLILLLSFGFQRSSREAGSTKKELGKAALILLTVIPILFFHESKFESSSWAEVGLLVRGPNTFVFVLVAAISMLGSATASLYLRGKK